MLVYVYIGHKVSAILVIPSFHLIFTAPPEFQHNFCPDVIPCAISGTLRSVGITKTLHSG